MEQGQQKTAGARTLEARLAEEGDREAWERYQLSSSAGHHAFCWAWRAIIEEVFGHRPYYIIAAADGGAPAGILPLFHVQGLLFGSALISVPYLNGGGILADSHDASRALVDRAQKLAAELNARYIELRHRAPLGADSLGLEERSHKVSMLLDLEGPAEEIFNSFPPKLRSQIRRPRKSGIQAEIDGGSLTIDASLAAFFAVFSEHMRDLGTPVFPRALFAATKRHFRDSCRIITVWHEGKPISAGITVRHGAYAEIPWAASLRRYNQHSPNMLLYWEAIKAASDSGCSIFDFGRSSYETGPYRFKQQWNPRALPLYWYYHVRKGEIPNVSPANPKYSTLVRCWQRLPLSVANMVGPWITKSLP